MTNTASTKPGHERWFYSVATLVLLILTFIGFRYFYLHGQAFPGRPLTPPIRTLVIIHGLSMTAWMLLAVIQPLLVALNRRRIHMTLGIFGAFLALFIVVAGYLTGVNAAKVNPPDLTIFGLDQKRFLTVPLSGVLTFGLFVAVGLWNRKKPNIHRPMMFMASLAAIAAAMGRMPALNDWYAGTWLEYCLSAFVTTLLLGALILVVKCILQRRIDYWFAGAYGMLFLICLATSLIAKTDTWVKIATALMS